MKTIAKITTLLGILFISLSATAQLKVKSNGYIGIGTSSPLKILHVSGGTALFQCSTNKNIEISNWNISGNGCVTLNAHLDDNSAHIPLSFAASSFYFHGGYVGIGRNPSYMLDVNGNIRVNSTVYTSDERMKSNIQPISSQIGNLLKLRSVSYTLKTSNLKSTKNKETIDSDNIIIESSEKDNRLHYGFLAQEVKQIYPELVYEDKDGILGIDYVSFIPLLIAELKQQNETIENLKQEIEILKTTNSNTLISNEDKSLGELYQNYPNPFDKNTLIKFRLSNGTNSAMIYLYDLQGNQIKCFEISNANESIEIEASELRPGMYLYSLVANGELLDTKTMILTQ